MGKIRNALTHSFVRYFIYAISVIFLVLNFPEREEGNVSVMYTVNIEAFFRKGLYILILLNRRERFFCQIIVNLPNMLIRDGYIMYD